MKFRPHSRHVLRLPWTAVAIPDQVVGQEAAEQRRPLAGPVGKVDHQATNVVVGYRLRQGPEESKRMDVAIYPSFRYCRRIGLHIATVAMRQVEHEEVRFPLHATNHHHRFKEIRLLVAGRMR
ncbi:hypothetical protein D9M69_131490 [compost metagenome]